MVKPGGQKSCSKLVNLCCAWPVKKALQTHLNSYWYVYIYMYALSYGLNTLCPQICFCSDREISQYLLQLVQVNLKSCYTY